MPEKKKKINRARLDNAAKIYPAAMRKNRSNVFRLSATFSYGRCPFVPWDQFKRERSWSVSCLSNGNKKYPMGVPSGISLSFYQ